MVNEVVKAMLAEIGIDVDEEKARIRAEMEEEGLDCCVVCGNSVDYGVVKEEFNEILYQAVMLGVDSLNNRCKMACDGKFCSMKCFREYKTCVVCGEPVDLKAVIEEFSHILKQAHYHGVDSLTEQEQIVYEGRCCSTLCFAELLR